MKRRAFLGRTVGVSAAWLVGCNSSDAREQSRPLPGGLEPELGGSTGGGSTGGGSTGGGSTGGGSTGVDPVDPAGVVAIEPDPTELDRGQIRGTPELDSDFPEWTLADSSASANTVLMFRGNPSHSFYGTGPIPEKPELAWRARLGEARGTRADGTAYHWQGTGWTGQPVVWGHRVYVGALDNTLYCFNTQTGDVIWRYQAGGMFKSSCCFYAGRLYVGNVDNRIRCIDARDGKQLWNYYNPRDCDSSPCVVDDKLYIGGEDGRIKCLNPDSGDLHWQLDLGGGEGAPAGSGGIESSPAVADGEVFVGHYDGFLACVDAATGELRWKAKTGADSDSSPVVVGERVFIAAQTESPYLRCFDRGANGALMWEFANRRGFWSTPAVVDDRLYVGGHGNVMFCLDARSGAVVWTFKAGAPIWSSPCVVDGRIIFGSHDHWFYVLDAATGDLVWRYEMAERTLSTACVVGGRIYVGSANGWFHCFA